MPASSSTASGNRSGGGPGPGTAANRQSLATDAAAAASSSIPPLATTNPRASPDIATTFPWTHPPNQQQYPPPPATFDSSYGRNTSGSPAPSSSSAAVAGPSKPTLTKTSKTPQTIADAVAASVGNKKERKRKRIHYSCAECHRRKSVSTTKAPTIQRCKNATDQENNRSLKKCDRNIPCGPCIERGLESTCRAFEQGDEFGDYRDRITRLEDIVGQYEPL